MIRLDESELTAYVAKAIDDDLVKRFSIDGDPQARRLGEPKLFARDEIWRVLVALGPTGPLVVMEYKVKAKGAIDA